MYYSIITIVKNDREIENTLEALKKYTAKENCEVIVVDASSPKELADIKNRFPEVKWIYYKSSHKKTVTIPQQRNLGYKQSVGDIIIYLDAGCVPSSSWFKTIKLAMDKEKNDIVTGHIKSTEGSTSHDWGYERLANNSQVNECGAANLILTRKVLENIGLFDETLPYGEDVDLSWRAIDAGYKIIFKKDAIVFHNWGSFAQDIKRSFRYGLSRGVLYKKHHKRLKQLLGYDSTVVIYPVFIILLPLTIVVPYYPLVLILPLLYNFKHYPFRTVFLHLIYGLGTIKSIAYGMGMLDQN